jgi:hypothetical protein
VAAAPVGNTATRPLPSQVEELLLGDPENAELSEMYNSLTEVG